MLTRHCSDDLVSFKACCLPAYGVSWYHRPSARICCHLPTCLACVLLQIKSQLEDWLPKLHNGLERLLQTLLPSSSVPGTASQPSNGSALLAAAEAVGGPEAAILAVQASALTVCICIPPAVSVFVLEFLTFSLRVYWRVTSVTYYAFLHMHACRMWRCVVLASAAVKRSSSCRVHFSAGWWRVAVA